MPKMKMAEQTGNSCAAHCTVVAIAELFDTPHNMTPQYAEHTVWPLIMFKTGEGALTDHLASLDNSDPRRVVAFANATGGGEAVSAALLCDETVKQTALGFVGQQDAMGLRALFNMMKGAGSTVTTDLREGVYYNCSFLMFGAGQPAAASYSGMHNILVTSVGNVVWCYNSNETAPAWVQAGPGAGWMILRAQNGGGGSYVFTGVCVSMASKA